MLEKLTCASKFDRARLYSPEDREMGDKAADKAESLKGQAKDKADQLKGKAEGFKDKLSDKKDDFKQKLPDNADQAKEKLPEPKQAATSAWSVAKPFVNGGASGMLATCIIQPVDMVKVRLQLGAQGSPVSPNPALLRPNWPPSLQYKAFW